MLRISILLVLLMAIGFAGAVHAQDAGQRARELAASLDKQKYKKKENKYVSIELYIDIKNEAAARSDRSAYSGVYEMDDYSLDLKVSGTGEATGSGYDSPMADGRTVKFELREGRVEGALLTAVKAYENGETRKFEAVFVNRTVSTGKNKDNIESRETAFGLGFTEGGPVVALSSDKMSGWTNRVFLERKN
jgi:hypothetical protein